MEFTPSCLLFDSFTHTHVESAVLFVPINPANDELDGHFGSFESSGAKITEDGRTDQIQGKQ